MGLIAVARRAQASCPNSSTCATPATPRATSGASSAMRASRSASDAPAADVGDEYGEAAWPHAARASRAARSATRWASARRARRARRWLDEHRRDLRHAAAAGRPARLHRLAGGAAPARPTTSPPTPSRPRSRDPRFAPLARHELERTDVEVSLLSPPAAGRSTTRTTSSRGSRPGRRRHRAGRTRDAARRSCRRCGKTLPTREHFFGQLKRKAGLRRRLSARPLQRPALHGAQWTERDLGLAPMTAMPNRSVARGAARRAAGGTCSTTAACSATSARATAGCTKASAACASCASARASGWCSPPTAARPASASTRSRRSRSTTSTPARGALVRHRRLQPRLQVLPELGHLQVARDGHADGRRRSRTRSPRAATDSAAAASPSPTTTR